MAAARVDAPLPSDSSGRKCLVCQCSERRVGQVVRGKWAAGRPGERSMLASGVRLAWLARGAAGAAGPDCDLASVYAARRPVAQTAAARRRGAFHVKHVAWRNGRPALRRLHPARHATSPLTPVKLINKCTGGGMGPAARGGILQGRWTKGHTRTSQRRSWSPFPAWYGPVRRLCGVKNFVLGAIGCPPLCGPYSCAGSDSPHWNPRCSPAPCI